MADTKIASKEIIDEVVTPEIINDDVISTPSSTDNDYFVVPFSKIAESFYVNPRTFIHKDLKKNKEINQLAGQQYWIVTYNGKALTTMDHNFVKASELNDLYEVRLKRNGDYLEIVNFTTISGKLNAETLHSQIQNLQDERRERQAISTKRLAYINSVDLASVNVDQSLVNSLIAAV